MNLTQHIEEAFGNIFISKMRSALTLLGILIGTASVVALVSSGELATAHALSQFSSLGTDLLAVSMNPSESGTTTTGQDNRLTLAQIPAIRLSNSDILEAAPYTMYYAPLSYNDLQIDGGILGATENLYDVVKMKLQSGRFVTRYDRTAFYAVIGSSIAEKIENKGVDPIGQQIRAGNYFFTIVGVLKPWPENIFVYANVDESVIIPIENSFLLSKDVQIQNIVFKLKPKGDIDQVRKDVTAEINKEIPDQQLFFRSAKQLIASMEKQRQTLTLFLTLIGGISLIVGGIGVMNIMFVSVVERRREIGIRLAIGARPTDIGLMFITEAIVLTMFGGLLGILCGEIISFFAAEFSGWGFAFFPWPPLIGFLVSVFVGIFFGFYPAYKASQLDPIQTLRSD